MAFISLRSARARHTRPSGKTDCTGLSTIASGPVNAQARRARAAFLTGGALPPHHPGSPSSSAVASSTATPFSARWALRSWRSALPRRTWPPRPSTLGLRPTLTVRSREAHAPWQTGCAVRSRHPLLPLKPRRAHGPWCVEKVLHAAFEAALSRTKARNASQRLVLSSSPRLVTAELPAFLCLQCRHPCLKLVHGRGQLADVAPTRDWHPQCCDVPCTPAERDSGVAPTRDWHPQCCDVPCTPAERDSGAHTRHCRGAYPERRCP